MNWRKIRGLWQAERGSIGIAQTQVDNPPAAGAGGGAPVGAEYYVRTLHADLTAERRLTVNPIPDTQPPTAEITGGATANSDAFIEPRGWNLRRTAFFCNEFGANLGPQDTYMYRQDTLLNGGSTAGAGDTDFDNEVGGMRLDTAAVAIGDGLIVSPPISGAEIDFDVNTIILFRIRVEQTTNFDAQFGISEQFAIGAAGSIHSAIFRLAPAVSANIRTRTSDGATGTEQDYAPAVAIGTTYRTYQFRRTATEVRFRVDNNAEQVITTTLPGTGIIPNFRLQWGIISAGAAGVRVLENSYYAYWRTGLSR